MSRGVSTAPRYIVRGLFFDHPQGEGRLHEWVGVPSIAGIMALHPELEELGPYAIQRMVHTRVNGILKKKKNKATTRIYIERMEKSDVPE